MNTKKSLSLVFVGILILAAAWINWHNWRPSRSDSEPAPEDEYGRKLDILREELNVVNGKTPASERQSTAPPQTKKLYFKGKIPSESDGRAVLEQKIQQQSKGLIRLVSFRKTDGVARETMGMKLYDLMYSAEIELTNDCYWGDGGRLGWQGGFFAERPTGGISQMVEYSKSGKKGQREQVSATLGFERTENGWSLVR